MAPSLGPSTVLIWQRLAQRLLSPCGLPWPGGGSQHFGLYCLLRMPHASWLPPAPPLSYISPDTSLTRQHVIGAHSTPAAAHQAPPPPRCSSPPPLFPRASCCLVLPRRALASSGLRTRRRTAPPWSPRQLPSSRARWSLPPSFRPATSAASPSTTRCTRGRWRTRRRSGRTSPTHSTGSAASTKWSTPTLTRPRARCFRRGSAEARPTCATTLSTGTWPQARATRWPSTTSPTRRARSSPRGLMLRRWPRCSASPTHCAAPASRRATASHSSCRWCLSWRWRCSRALGSAPSTPSSSEASPPRHSPRGSRTPPRASSSRPTG
mmetsp:Transcript_10039/g.32934  ORF Transcript_10039/g.32934 Transcript_10039/m.32934 type:complete len:323 (-) Transcript_10039:1671-2639(-)